jgi:ribosomal protein S18 acetylase RimI-like enzyme
VKHSINTAGLSRARQGQGIGSLLLDNEINILRLKGCKSIRTDVHYNCSSAIPFYYKHGFRIVDFSLDHYGKGHDAIILKKTMMTNNEV